MKTEIPEGETFRRAWGALPRADRLRVRRLVRLGRPLAGDREAAMAIAYARLQRSRPWARVFWLWFVPGLLVALSISARIHPVVVGVVIALAAQAAFAHRNMFRVERVNATALEV